MRHNCPDTCCSLLCCGYFQHDWSSDKQRNGWHRSKVQMLEAKAATSPEMIAFAPSEHAAMKGFGLNRQVLLPGTSSLMLGVKPAT